MIHSYDLVLKYFKGNHNKTIIWFCLPNPGIGNIPPYQMIMNGRQKKLLKYIKSCLEGNRP